MPVQSKLASALGRRDELPNIDLAIQIVKKKDESAIKELVALLSHKSTALQNDSIKVLYETGEREPALIAGYLNVFLSLLKHKNNRLQWGAMQAIYSITEVQHTEVFKALPQIMEAAEKGSVITRDGAVNILVTLCHHKKYINSTYPLLLELIRMSPENQFPTYAEKALSFVTSELLTEFRNTLALRHQLMKQETKKKRIEKLLKKLSKFSVLFQAEA